MCPYTSLTYNDTTREKPPAPKYDKLAGVLLGKSILRPALDHPTETVPQIKSYEIHKVVEHNGRPGKKNYRNYKYHLRLTGYGPESFVEYRVDELPQCQEMIAAYKIENSLNIAPTPDPPSHNTRKRKRSDERNWVIVRSFEAQANQNYSTAQETLESWIV